MQKDSVLGLKIAYYRKLNGLTQEELAEKAGVSTQAVSKETLINELINVPNTLSGMF